VTGVAAPGVTPGACHATYRVSTDRENRQVRAVQITEFGGPEVLAVSELPDPEATPGHVLLNVTSAGVNYADTHQVEDSYLAKQELPLIPGGEVVGTTADGRRVAGFLGSAGGYASRAVVPESMAFDVPEGISDGEALGLLVQGLTAWHLLQTSAPLRGGETVAVHAAAGGVGSQAVQLAKLWGAGTVVGSASSEEKRQLVLDLGADAAFDSRADDMKSAIEGAAGGKVDVVLDMIGGSGTDGSLAALAPFGRLVHFGQASRQQPSPVDLGALMGRSRSVIGFWLAHCFSDPAGMIGAPLAGLFELVAKGDLKVVVHEPYPLADVRRAHEDMRAGLTAGKVVLDCTG
jgi:NADPH2:quinone reductase